ncbi:hypothetical protein [Sorangium sp. So ce1000]|uniref:hypothetical protein n=1 Tax=Sorangium sp. So ce1000 TaxID=3133325 RepID=UPI003F5E53EF
MNNFNDPARLTAVLEDVGRVRAFIRQTTGRPWPLALAAGGVGVGIAQVRRRFGLPPGRSASRACSLGSRSRAELTRPVSSSMGAPKDAVPV